MPIAARASTWPERASPNAATAASSGIRMVESGSEILCHSPVSTASVCRPAARSSAIFSCSRPRLRVSGAILASVKPPGAGHLHRAGGGDDPGDAVALPVVDPDPLQPGGGAAPDHQVGADHVVA